MTSEERRELWKKLEREYTPWRHFETDTFLGEGRMWQRQTHIYRWPFYYIDYVLAQVCALELHVMDEENHEKAWECYKNIIKLSGTKGFNDVVTSAGLPSPFEEDVIEELAKKVAGSIV